MKDKKDRHENPSEQDFIAQNESDECSQNGDATQGESANSDESEQKDALIACEIQLAELKDKYMRANAEFENIKKRLEKEKASALAYAN